MLHAILLCRRCKIKLSRLTFIGVRVDFNNELIECITKINGANRCSVCYFSEFKQRMGDEFDFVVTPLVFDLPLRLDAPGYETEKVYGSPEADLATGDLIKVFTGGDR